MLEAIVALIIIGFIAIPIIAIIMASAATNQVKDLREDLDILESRVARSETLIAGTKIEKPPVPTPAEPAHEAKADTPQYRKPPPIVPATPPVGLDQKKELLADLAKTTETTLPSTTPAYAPPSAPPVEQKAEEAGEKVTLEERLGARLPVWIGSIALAVAGILLVKYKFEKGLLSPAIRISLGIIFGLLLLAVGEWMRKRSTNIGQGLSAAGIADLFACLLAATNYYNLISPIIGFISMAAVTALAVVLSLRQGPFVALLGLVGGFITPMLIRIGDPNPSIFAYLFMLELGLLWVTRRQGWWILSILTLVGGMVWAAVWMLTVFDPDHSNWIGPFLLGTVLCFALATHIGRAQQAWGNSIFARTLTWASTGAGLVLVCLLVGVSEFSNLEWAFFGLLGTGCMVLGRINHKQQGLAGCSSGNLAACSLVFKYRSNQPSSIWCNHPGIRTALRRRRIYLSVGLSQAHGLGKSGGRFGNRLLHGGLLLP